MQYKQITLKNNLKVLYVNSPGSTAASVQMWFRAGSALEQEKDYGIAHFLEHMFFKGTAKRPGSAIAHEVESYGAEVNAFTSFDYTCYYINTPNSKLNKTVEILMDMVSNPLFKQEDLTPERNVVFEEFKRSVDNPNQFSFKKIQEHIFTGGYSHPILGTEKNILNFSKKQLTDFRKKFYNTSNAMLVIAGDIKNQDKISKLIEKFNIPNGPSSEFSDFKLQKQSKIHIHKKEIRSGQLNLIIQAPNYHDKHAPHEDLVFNCLGHGDSSRFYKKLVIETGLATSCSSSTMYMAKGGVHFTRITFPMDNLDKVTDELNQLLKEIAIEGIKEEEIQKIKNQYVASKIYEKESIESYAFSLGHGFAQSESVDCEDKFIDQMRRCSKLQVNESLKNIFRRSFHITMQIPISESIPNTKKTLKKLQSNIKEIQKSIQTKSTKYPQKSSKFDPQVKVIEIKKGVQLIHRHNPISPTFAFHSYLRGGITEENHKTNGSYYLISSLLTKGYGDVSADEINLSIEDKSASINGFSGKNAYGLILHGQTKDMSKLVDHFSGSLINPSFLENKLDHEIEMINRILENQKEDPTKVCFSKVSELFFKDHPYSMNIIGNEKSIKNITTSNLKKIHKDNLTNKDILFTYCGDLEAEEVIKLIEPITSKLKPREFKDSNVKSYEAILDKKIHINFDREQTQIFIGRDGKQLGHKDNIYLNMLTAHLSGQSSSLFVEVRDKQGLCYAVQPVHFTALEGGYWGIYMASSSEKTEKATDAIMSILEDIKNKGLKKTEFNRLKLMIEGQSEINVQTNEDYANIYSIPTFQHKGIDYFYKNNEKIKELTYESFQKNIKKLMNTKWNIVTVGR